jgi:ribosomal protein L14
MIQLLTKVNIVDNSGAVLGRCIKILKPHNRDYAKIGDLILVSILEIAKVEGSSKGGSLKGTTSTSIRDINKIKKGTMFKALVVRTKSKTFASAPQKSVSFDQNSVVLLPRGQSNPGAAQKKTNIFDTSPIGTRIKGPISILLSPPGCPAGSNPASKLPSQFTSFTKVTSLCSNPL